MPIKCIQFWDKSPPPDEVAALIGKWRAAPGLDHHLFDWKMANAFILEHFGERECAAFRDCLVPAMQADFFRYCALYVLGGLYVDADTCPSGEGLAAFLAGHERGVLMRRQMRIANDFLYFSRPGDPLLAKVIDIACTNILSRTSNNVWLVTGPGIMTDLVSTEKTASLFSEFSIINVADIKAHVKFIWKMDYKDTSDDWRTASESASIFKS